MRLQKGLLSILLSPNVVSSPWAIRRSHREPRDVGWKWSTRPPPPPTPPPSPNHRLPHTQCHRPSFSWPSNSGKRKNALNYVSIYKLQHSSVNSYQLCDDPPFPKSWTRPLTDTVLPTSTEIRTNMNTFHENIGQSSLISRMK